MDCLEGDFELLDTLADFSDDRDDLAVFIVSVSEALEAGENRVL